MLLRGDLSVSDVNTVMAKLQPSLNMVHFNSDGNKIDLEACIRWVYTLF